MNRETLLYRQQKFHEFYQQRLASANGREEAMARDLASYDTGIELLLKSTSYRAGQQAMPNFATVYGWILYSRFPLSFRDPAALRKKINIPLLEESPDFAYLVGAYQAAVGVIHPRRFTIETDDVSLENEVERRFRALHMAVQNKKVVYMKNTPNQRTIRRIYVCSISFMNYISVITENNSRIPHECYISSLMNAYLSGFCDKGASPSYSTSKSNCSSLIRIYPRLEITKKGNVPLLSAVNSALNFLGISSCYNPQSNPQQVCVYSLESIKKFIDLGLFRSREKMNRLKDSYAQWKQTSEFDRNGAYNKLKKQILLERFAKQGKYIEETPVDDED